MGKFYGTIGYSETVETSPGRWKQTVTEYNYYGDYMKYNSSTENSEHMTTNDDIVLNSQISIVADPYAYSNFRNMKYVVIAGTKWKIKSVEPQFPRIIITTGGLYNA